MGWASKMKHIVYHIMIPAIMPVVFFIIATTPVEVLGCRTRGIIALLIALISGLAAIGTANMGTKVMMRGEKYTLWWVATSIILVIPLIALVIMA